ncbi:hypothetical protein HCG51_26720 [Tolypothrix sp. PCC 7910]|uniref:hypothetical protein n=1 Tax=Tolypothrix sp. PCC 7910 TaxID=2099387 RepID=UPI001427948F|nr:hypothetical protein [Tolypothrix sp. PCC 7910]QIR39946.1 hypothetical protein HCG51_26720 [Tolypothrix sp. PCC 7910]
MYEPQDTKKGKFYNQNLPKIIVAILFAIIIATCGYFTTLLLLFNLDISSIFNKRYPTSIPDIDNQSQCENSERIWRYQKCWDYQHDPLF